MRKLTLALGAIAALAGLHHLRPGARPRRTTGDVLGLSGPGTLTASAKTQITFRGGDADAIGTVTVTRLEERHPRREAASRTPTARAPASCPTKAFEAGREGHGPTDATVVNADDGDFSFKIGDETRRTLRPVEAPDVGRGTVQSFATRQDLAPPAVTVTKRSRAPPPASCSSRPKGGRGQDGPMIIDNAGKLVWFKATPGQGRRRLPRPDLPGQAGAHVVGGAALRGRRRRGRPDLRLELQAASRRCTRGNGYTFDLHEFTITPRNTALVLAYERYNRSLKPWGGPSDAKIVDNIVQEIDLATGLVLFEWHSFGNVSPDESDVAGAQARRARSGSTSTPTRSTSTTTATSSSPPATRRRSTRSTAARARSSGAWAARSPTSSSARA